MAARIPADRRKTPEERTEYGRAISRARSRADGELGRRHPEEYAELLHVEKHAENLEHTHGPADPETIDWWGPERGLEPEPAPRRASRLASSPNTTKGRSRRST